jgi:hypothetical protein
MKPCLYIALGPPADAGQRALFDEYQEARSNKDEEDWPDWNGFERQCLNVLFAADDETPSAVAEFLGEIYGKEVEVALPFMGIGFVRDMWVMSMCIEVDDVLFSDGGRVPWPPSDEGCSDLASFFGYLLKRDWVQNTKVG